MSFFQIKDLVFSHKDSETQNSYHFNLTLQSGEILTLGGMSGAGKSTLLDLVAGFLQPASGSILLDGTEITHLAPAFRSVSILFQKNNLFEHLSVLQNVCLGINSKTKPTTHQKNLASQMLEKTGLGGYEARPAHSLSGGQMQRVALARELLRNSKLLLLDEPFSGLDDATKSEIVPLLKEIVESKDRAIILVSHDQTDRSLLNARAAVVREGRIFTGNNL